MICRKKYEGKKAWWMGYVENIRNLKWKGGIGDIFVAAAEQGAAGGKYILDVKIGDVPVKVILPEESKEQAYKLIRVHDSVRVDSRKEIGSCWFA